MPGANEYIQRREIEARAMTTAEWDMVEAQVRERAFFMAGVENARILQEFKEAAREIAAGNLTTNEARKRLRGALRAAGYEPAEDERGGIHDLSSRRRMEVTLRTNVDMARGWMQREQMKKDKSQPGLRLYRAQDAEQPRDWQRRWAEAAQAVDWEGVARGGQMVALIESPIWVELSRFGNPYPPFDFGSKVRVRAVPYEECEKLGLVGGKNTPQPEEVPEEYDSEYSGAAAEGTDIVRADTGADSKEAPGKTYYKQEQKKARLQSLNENQRVSLRGLDEDIKRDLIKREEGIAKPTPDGQWLEMIDKNGTRRCHHTEIGAVITARGEDGAPNLLEDAAVSAINDSSVINKSAPDDPRRLALTMLRDRIIPTVSDGSDPNMQLNRALSFSNVQEFNKLLDRLSIPQEGESDTWYRPRPGYVVDSWNNNELTVHRFANKRYSIILHMNKYHSRRRIDGLYPYLLPRLKHIEGVGIATEGESWMPGDIRLRVVNRKNPKITETEDGRITYEFWVEEI